MNFGTLQRVVDQNIHILDVYVYTEFLCQVVFQISAELCGQLTGVIWTQFLYHKR